MLAGSIRSSGASARVSVYRYQKSTAKGSTGARECLAPVAENRTTGSIYFSSWTYYRQAFLPAAGFRAGDHCHPSICKFFVPSLLPACTPVDGSDTV